ncbi:conserved hypothetical protein [uncultured Mycobacterium sp.]|uniref:Uncharacterized protein n=1 Tax=uncultured Mycobacterium sp. TaxID=171292 RepID=A0A1Y5PHR3_9MYCO|nr:conserved hypothetical protein [uncultured Mycobacterium sp.]
MTKSIDKNTEATHAMELADEVRESAKAGQHGAAEALHKFRHTVDEAIPENLQPLRKTIVDAALELADQLVTAQYEFHRSIVRTANRALSNSGDAKD